MRELLTSRKFAMNLHLALMGLWVILIVPTMLYWKESILWVLIISIYANIVGHYSSFEAVRSTPKNREEADA